MVVLATCELYGGFMTFCPEWLVGNVNLDGSNFMYMWVYLVFFNMLWVFIPLYALWYSYRDISHAFTVRASKKGQSGLVADCLLFVRWRRRQHISFGSGHDKNLSESLSTSKGHFDQVSCYLY
ncbi:hypothetical protein G3M48_009691 [Beauveria asiatica]|uniref:EXPERA domain-containing protein n=1 Tax=Beauveria asiatica TaxID=1069075 RepID=A0AAW0RIA1_9HYPO